MAKDVAISKQNSPKTNKTKKQNKTQLAFFFFLTWNIILTRKDQGAVDKVSLLRN